MRVTAIAVLLIPILISPAHAVQPVKGAVKGTATVGRAVVTGTSEAGKDVMRGTSTVVRATGRGLHSVFTLGIRC